MTKLKILIFIDWFYPAFKAGGPIKSVFNIVNSLSDKFDFYIVTSAYDLNENQILKGVSTNQWLDKGNYQIIYLEKPKQNKAYYKSLIQFIQPDKIYLNSLFSSNFTLKPLLVTKSFKKIKVIIAVRGMLGKNALAIKALKKRIFLSISRNLAWFKNVIWHASTVHEQKEIEAVFGKNCTIFLAQNIASIVEKRPLESIHKSKGELRLIFFSRINPKKNLLFALEVLKVANHAAIQLDIYGPIEDADYWEDCLKFIQQHQLNVHYKGMISPVNLVEILWQYDFLFFPTLHENYGHVIAESLCSSLPVIISKNTPWLDLESANIGVDLALKVDLFVEKLNYFIEIDKTTYLEMVEAAYAYSQLKIVNSDIITQNEKLFLNEHN